MNLLNVLWAVWRYPEERQRAHQADQWHPDVCGSHYVHQCLQGQQCQGKTCLLSRPSDTDITKTAYECFSHQMTTTCLLLSVFCFPSAVWLHFSGPHQDFQDREACQLCCYLPHYGSCKSRPAQQPLSSDHVQKCILWLHILTLLCVVSAIQVVMGGGQEAMEVTTTSTRIGKFEARWGKVSEKNHVPIFS